MHLLPLCKDSLGGGERVSYLQFHSRSIEVVSN